MAFLELLKLSEYVSDSDPYLFAFVLFVRKPSDVTKRYPYPFFH
jgi:hypothetical protein